MAENVVSTALVACKWVPSAQRLTAPRYATPADQPHRLDTVNEVGAAWALRLRTEGLVGRVVAISMGPPDAAAALTEALAHGADEAFLITDPALDGADVRRTARVLAQATADLGAHLLVCGYESADGASGIVPAAMATALGWPLVTRVRDGRAAADGSLDLRRSGPDGIESWTARLPAVVSLVEGGIVPGYPPIRSLLRARKARIPQLAVGDRSQLDTPAHAARIVRIEPVPRPPREPRVMTEDDGVGEVVALLAGVKSWGGRS
ncbi:electron transfer flavoprotein subunit beta/FixA family protein [Nonomuraea endophytica]|uniref:Electron transfer flavoprotein small subunit n=1 Tax=Nonomuraea endophytica TaxID=714136 RepID=A0A7W8A8C4_9ACTN|nr:hypothetical protein [Nonomuraea endophytica]MBB5081497.1 electron transfer flavoprotein beta subunit [Nonomuraea endophytica]